MADTVQTVDCEKSSNIRWARYFPVERRLEIDFKGKDGKVNSTYEYQSFGPMDWEAFNAAESKGKHFAFNIRNKRDAQGDPAFPARRIK